MKTLSYRKDQNISFEWQFSDTEVSENFRGMLKLL